MPASVRLPAVAATFIVVTVLVGVIFGDATNAPVIIGMAASLLIDAAISVLWIRRERHRRQSTSGR